MLLERNVPQAITYMCLLTLHHSKYQRHQTVKIFLSTISYSVMLAFLVRNMRPSACCARSIIAPDVLRFAMKYAVELYAITCDSPVHASMLLLAIGQHHETSTEGLAKFVVDTLDSMDARLPQIARSGLVPKVLSRDVANDILSKSIVKCIEYGERLPCPCDAACEKADV
jgi:hypothetical protein